MKRWDETWHRLLDWTSGQAPSERLSAQVLLADGFSCLDPSHLAVAPSVLDLEVRRLEREARTRLANLQGLLGRNVVEGRKALEALLDGPLRFTPVQTKDGRRYEITGAAAVGFLCTTDCVPKGIRTPVTALKGPCPGPG